MKKALFFFLFVLLLGFAARAEFYSAGDDLYYHQCAVCCGRDDLSLIAGTEGLFPCPVCADDPVPHIEPEAFALGDKVIIRVPDEWMSSRTNIGEVFASWDHYWYAGPEAEKFASQYLHGAAYRNFLTEEGAYADAHYPGLYRTDEYSVRHIGGSWYVCTCLPEDAPQGEYTFTDSPRREEGAWRGYLRFFGGKAWRQDGLTHYYEPDEWGDRDYEMPIRPLDPQPVFRLEKDGIEISLYALDDVTLCVVGGELPQSEYAALLLDGMPVCEEVTACEGQYCAVLTRAEAFRLQNGAELRVFDGTYSAMDFGPSEYAVFNYEIGGWFSYERYSGVIDRAGREVLPRRFYRVERCGDRFFCTLIRDNELAEGETEGMYVYDPGEGDAPKYVYSETDAYIYLKDANDAVFVLEWNGTEHKFVFCDMKSGAVLGEISQNLGSEEERSYYSASMHYACADGRTERVCFNGAYGAFLLDNEANVVASYFKGHKLRPLTWVHGKGLFLLMEGKDCGNLPDEAEIFLHGVEADDYFDCYGEYNIIENWEESKKTADIRFALVDESGRLLTNADYSYVRVLNARQVELGKRDGSRIVVETDG